MKNKTESVSLNKKMKETWKRRIMLEKDYTEKSAEWMAERVEALIDHLQYGHAAIAYRKQDGTFCLVKGTLIYYEAAFRRPYEITRIQNAIVYWNVEQQQWTNFILENFMEWRPIV